ncbi:DUF4153 domain-containing protein [Phenylobacterium sp.]|uniref:DUF4153 domain-containing protein n=1 Tax=Phenylobacterium sp. TaxID=1871053 RepID=UPI0035B265E5
MGDLEMRTSRAGWTRLAIGLVQGVLLYLLFDRLAPAAGRPVAPWLAALRAVAALTPFVLLAGLGAMRRGPLLAWTAAAAALAGGVGAYAAATGGDQLMDRTPWPLFVGGTAAALFILHHLIEPADQERRWRAAYVRYFDLTWTNGVRLALCGLFVAALWALLHLGATLFAIIGLDEVRKTITEHWFAMPVSTTAFAAGVHLTDMRASLVRGVRTVALALLSWLLPLMALFCAAFLAALPFTGLRPLWDTRSAAGVVLSAAAALIILTNAAYQDGRRDDVPAVLKWAARLACVIVAPLVAIAAYAVALRIGQHGLTPERVAAAACVVVGAAFGVGYLLAAVARRGWLRRIEPTNVVTAYLAVAVLLALMSPLADPRRLSVQDQLHRLDAGAVSPAGFDYAFLRRRAGAAGMSALKALAARKSGPGAAEIARRAAEALKAPEAGDGAVQPAVADRAALVTVAGAKALPASFLQQAWTAKDDPFRGCAPPREAGGVFQRCLAMVADVDGDGRDDVVFLGPTERKLYVEDAGRWTAAAEVSGPGCREDVAAFEAGAVKVAPPLRFGQLEVGGRRLSIAPASACPPAESAAKGGDRVAPAKR